MAIAVWSSTCLDADGAHWGVHDGRTLLGQARCPRRTIARRRRHVAPPERPHRPDLALNLDECQYRV
ncbi:hypothetical protein E1161_13545 [Saccharopolyspora aridisoli]|uniref:Uncharacterized protein n=3 Tax=Saccharopolyspora TaxID=1835 RepID=A0A4R4VP09_9PSEU|nr:hypothetical protein E1161_13545 [Saccharopolyspora aridisoli]TDD03995.1 hypothetical protein E1181_19015 [Saccharopolyspora terrae]TDD88794.1 hypothetical protein E1202_13065 [Saccharopolyspora karakumensis]